MSKSIKSKPVLKRRPSGEHLLEILALGLSPELRAEVAEELESGIYGEWCPADYPVVNRLVAALRRGGA